MIQVVAAIRRSTEQLGLTTLDVISKPYHDAAIMGTKVPVAMIFIPSKNGLSHHPDEYSSPEQVGDGVKTLALTLAKLAGSKSATREEL
jgi:ureidoglycolate amidohydrolase